MIEQIIFKSNNRWGSSLNRGVEISEQLKSIGYNASYKDPKEMGTKYLPADTKNSVIIVLKSMDVPEFQTLYQNGNKLILDVIDCIGNDDYSLEEICRWPYHGMIFPTEELASKAKELRPDLEVAVLPHHWDKRHLENVGKQNSDKLALGYIGSAGGLFHGELLKPASIVHDWSEQTRTSPMYNCHYSVRPKGESQYLYKPNSKASTAAAVGSNIITSRDKALENLLPEDYPYYTETDIDSVRDAIKYAEETYGTAVWEYGLECMKELKHKTSIEFIVENGYVEFINKFC